MRPSPVPLKAAVLAAAPGLGLAVVAGVPQDAEKPKLGYQDTPLLPGGRWHVHDGERPQPPIVDPGTANTQERPGRPPANALVLSCPAEPPSNAGAPRTAARRNGRSRMAPWSAPPARG